MGSSPCREKFYKTAKKIKILPVKTGKIIHAIQRKKIWAYYGRGAHRIKKEIMGGAPIE